MRSNVHRWPTPGGQTDIVGRNAQAVGGIADRKTLIGGPFPPKGVGARILPSVHQIAATSEHLQPTVGVGSDHQVAVSSSRPYMQRIVPARPAAIRRDLPPVPPGAVLADHEHLQSPSRSYRSVRTERRRAESGEPRWRGPEAFPARPAAVGRSLPFVPELAIGSDHEQLQTAIRIGCHNRRVVPPDTITRRTMRQPVAPAVVRRSLILFPEQAVAADHEDLEPPVGVCADCGRTREPNVRRSAEIKPVRSPAIARSGLRLRIQPMAAAFDDEHLEPAVLIDTDRRRALYAVRRTVMHPPVGPGAIGRGLPDVGDMAIAAGDKQLEPSL